MAICASVSYRRNLAECEYEDLKVAPGWISTRKFLPKESRATVYIAPDCGASERGERM